MEKEVKPYYEDDYQSLDEMSTIDLLEMKDDALAEYSDIEHLVNRINKILDSRIEGEDEVLFTIDYNYFLDNFDEWFEKIEEPTTSVRRTPKMGEAYFYVDEYGNVEREIWDNDGVDNELLAMGFVRLTPEEAAEARDRELAEVRLQRTSTFKPDFENDKGGWIIYYDHGHETLAVCELADCDAGEPVRYATAEDARRSIEENEQDWKIYFGIKEEE